MHYHIIPAPVLGSSTPQSVESQKADLSKDLEGGKAPLTRRQMHRMEFQSREELDDEDAELLVARIRARL